MPVREHRYGRCGVLERVFSRQSGVLAIGSDPNEWWVGCKTIISVLESQMGEMSGVKIVDPDTKAYSEGTVGWVASRMVMRMPDGLETPFRVTGVFHQEDGSWKVLQWHASIGALNEEAIGRKLTT